MTTNQKIRLRMYLGTRNFESQNQATANAIPKFAASYSILLCTIDEIQLIGEMQGINKTGLEMDKNKLKKRFIALAVKYSNKVAILAKLTRNDTLLKEVRFNESDLVRLSEVTLKDRVKIIYDKAEANLASLTEQGLTPDTQKQFLETITAFNNVLETPRTGIAEKRKATQKLPDPALMQYYQKPVINSKGHKVIIKVARKLLNRIRYVMKNRKSYVTGVA